MVVGNSYREWVEASYQAQPGVAGASRPAENTNPFERSVVFDDWSAGEGYKFYVSEQGHPSQRGYLGSGAVNVHIPGEVSLGWQTQATSSLATGGIPSAGAYLAVLDDNIWVAGADSAYEQTVLDTWTSRGTNYAAAEIIYGPIGTHPGGIFIAGTGGTVRLTSAAPTDWDVAVSTRGAAVANNRVWWFNQASPGVLEQTGLQTAAAGSTVHTFLGNDFATVAVSVAANGSLLYVLVVNSQDAPRLWMVENLVGREVAVFDGLFAGPNAPSKTAAVQFQKLCVVDGIVFVGGAETAQDGTVVGRLDYFDGERRGTVFTGERSKDTSQGALPEIVGVSPGRGHEVLLCTETDQWRYNLETGGISKFWDTAANTRAVMLAYLDGRYYRSNATGGLSIGVHRTGVSGASTYVASATIEMPLWDAELPDVEKILKEIEVHTDTLAAGTSVEVKASLDGAAAFSVGTHSSGTTSKFTVSTASSERTFKYLRVDIILATSNTANTPKLFRVIARAVPVPNTLRYFEFDINLQDETASDRKTGRQLTAAKQRAALETLRDSTSNRLFTFTPLYLSSGPPYPGPSGTQHTVMFAANTQNGIFESTDRGEGRMKLRLQKIS